MLADSFLIESSSKLLVTRTGIKAWTSSILGLWFPWPIYMFLKWDLTLAHWIQVSDRCPLGYLLFLSFFHAWRVKVLTLETVTLGSKSWFHTIDRFFVGGRGGGNQCLVTETLFLVVVVGLFFLGLVFRRLIFSSCFTVTSNYGSLIFIIMTKDVSKICFLSVFQGKNRFTYWSAGCWVPALLVTSSCNLFLLRNVFLYVFQENVFFFVFFFNQTFETANLHGTVWCATQFAVFVHFWSVV